MAKKPTDNLEAYDVYLKAREFHLQYDSLGGGLKKALNLYQEAITSDPTFADAYAYDAEIAATVWSQSLLSVLSQAEALERAQQSIARALKIDPSNAIAFRVQAQILSANGRHDEAIEKARHAVSLNAGDVTSRRQLAFILAAAGNLEEARNEIELARRSDPNPVTQDLYLASWVYFNTRQYEKATSRFDRFVKQTPNTSPGKLGLAASAAKQGLRSVAKKTVEDIRKRVPSMNWRWQEFTNGNLQADVLKHYIEALKLAGLLEWPFGFIGNEADRLTPEENKKLFWGHRLEGSGKSWGEYEQTIDEDGHWSLRFRKWDSVTKSQFYFKDGKTCYAFKGGVKGQEFCFYIYRNPKGTREELNEYVFTDVFDLYSFSVVD